MAGIDLSKYVPMKSAIEADLAAAREAQNAALVVLNEARFNYDEVTRQVENLLRGRSLVDAIIASLPKPEVPTEVVVEASTGETVLVEAP